MKRFFFWAGVFLLVFSPLAGYAAVAGASSPGSAGAVFAPKTSNERLSEWQHYMASQVSGKHAGARVPAKEAESIPASNGFGYLTGPDGLTWTYTMEYTKGASDFIEAVLVRVYDADQKAVGEFTDSFENLSETDTLITGVNSVEINSLVTKKFFNSDSNYEVMLFVHAVTSDHTGRYFTDVFSLGNPDKVCSIPGNQVLAQNLAMDEWSEKYTMVFQRDSIVYGESVDYTMFFDVYQYAGYGTGCKKVHTFEVDYALISGSGGNSVPILMQKNNGQVCYVTARYEKEFFDPSIPWYEEPVVQPDNAFLLTFHNSRFDTVATTRIPCEKEEGAFYSFPYIGGLRYNDDVAFDTFSPSDTTYVISFDNYVTASDEFQTSYYVYDLRGNRLKTIAQNSDDVLGLSDIRGQEAQFCFLYESDAQATFRFVDFPSCTEVLRLPTSLNGNGLSASMDRYPVGNSYQYVISLTNGDVAENGDVYHTIAWLNIDGTINHLDKVNLGQDIQLAQVNIDARYMDPYIFDTDADREYMFLVKRSRTPGGTATDELFYLVNTQGERLLEVGPDDTKGVLSWIAVTDEKTKPTLAIAHYDRAKGLFTPTFISLPLNSLEGSGKENDPYLIATVGDFRQIQSAPRAAYRIISDLNFDGQPFAGITEDFKGSLDGQDHILSNLLLDGNALFTAVLDGAVVKNLKLYKPTLVPGGSNYAGFVANQVSSAPGAPSHSTIENVMIYGAKVEDNTGFDGHFGGIAGSISLGSEISRCALFDADIVLSEDAYAGGIVGLVNTGSVVNACAFRGSLHAGVAAGIVGESYATDAVFSNCHSNADITGYEVAAGIVGANNRSLIANCYAEGNMEAKGGRWSTAVGGVVGSVQAPATAGADTVVWNCLVGVETLAFPEEGENVSAHRIVGLSRGDEKNIDYDAMEEWTDEQWTAYYNGELEALYVMGEPDNAFFDNYVTSALAVVDTEIGADKATVEGATLAAGGLTQEFMTERRFATGTTVDAPWVYAAAPYLWYESSVAGLLVDQENSTLVIGESLTLTFSLLNGKGSDIQVVAETDNIEITDRQADGEHLTVTVKAVAKGTATLKATYAGLSVTATIVCDKAHLRFDAMDGGINLVYTASDNAAVERDRQLPLSVFYVERADGSDRMLLQFYHSEEDADITIPAGTYTIALTQAEGTVQASEGVDNTGSLTPSYYTTLENDAAIKMYFFVAGTVEVTKLAGGNMKIVVDAVNSYDLPVHIVYDSTQTALENTDIAPETGTYKFIRNGQLYIFRNGRTYTVTGAAVE